MQIVAQFCIFRYIPFPIQFLFIACSNNGCIVRVAGYFGCCLYNSFSISSTVGNAVCISFGSCCFANSYSEMPMAMCLSLKKMI